MSKVKKIQEKIEKGYLKLTDKEKYMVETIIKEGKEESLDSLINILSNKFSDITPSSEFKNLGGKSSSEEINDSFFNIFIDLIVLFLNTNKIYNLIDTEYHTSMSELKKVEKKIDKVIEKLEIEKSLAYDDSSFDNFYIENFNDESMIQDYISFLYRDPRTNNLFYEDNLCFYDSINHCLTLSKSETIDNFDMEIQKEQQTGNEFSIINNNKNNPKNALYKRDDIKWEEIIHSPEPFNIEHQDISYYNQADEEYYSDGAICKLSISFNNPVFLNTISLAPYSELPFEVVRITGFSSNEFYDIYTNSNFDKVDAMKQIEGISNIYKILGPEEENQIRSPVNLDDNFVFSFTGADEVAVLEIALKQNKYTKQRYNITADEKENAEMINRLTKQKEIKQNINSTSFDDVIELDNFNTENNYKKILDKVNKVVESFDLSNDFITNLINGLEDNIENFNSGHFKPLSNNTQNKIKYYDINTFEYSYGLRNINIEYNHYNQESVFVSKAHNVKGNIKEVELNVNDTITNKGYGSDNYTIEYYISNLENPSADDWFPIIPENYKNIIENEDGYKLTEYLNTRINENNEIEGETRFKIKQDNIIVTKPNGTTVNANIIGDKTVKITDDIIVENLINKELKIEYYIDPNVDPFMLNFDDVVEPIQYIGDDNQPGELIKSGTDKNQRVELSYYPYIDYSQVNKTLVDPYLYNLDDELLALYNPNNFQYNPNFNVETSGYKPINIEFNGQTKVSNVDEDIVDYNGRIYNDETGIPYKFNYIQKEDDMYYEYEISRKEQIKENGIIKPYFYNITDYINNEKVGMHDFDYTDHPVFEYKQKGNKIYFNEPFNIESADNQGELRVFYEYLVEGIRVMAIIRKYKDNPDLTPAIYNYKLKTRNFRH